MTRDRKLINIFRHFGLRTQCRKLNEEAYEVTEAALVDCSKTELTKELADLKVVSMQLMLIYGIDPEDVDREADVKIDRTIARIESGYYPQPKEGVYGC